MAQGGLFHNNSDTESQMKYDKTNNKVQIKHTKRGDLSMVNSITNPPSMQFIIAFIACPWLDDKNHVFGQVLDGW